MGKIERSVGSCIEAWMLAIYGLCMGGVCPPKILYSSLDKKYGFVNKLSSYIQIFFLNVIVTSIRVIVLLG